MDRRIGLIWEITQAAIAIITVVANILVVFVLGKSNELLANAFFLIIGFYFGRTRNVPNGNGT